MIAVESGMDLPEFFMDKTFSRALHFNMSTSQVCAFLGLHINFVTSCRGPICVPKKTGCCLISCNVRAIKAIPMK